MCTRNALGAFVTPTTQNLLVLFHVYYQFLVLLPHFRSFLETLSTKEHFGPRNQKLMINMIEAMKLTDLAYFALEFRKLQFSYKSSFFIVKYFIFSTFRRLGQRIFLPHSWFWGQMFCKWTLLKTLDYSGRLWCTHDLLEHHIVRLFN